MNKKNIYLVIGIAILGYFVLFGVPKVTIPKPPVENVENIETYLQENDEVFVRVGTTTIQAHIAKTTESRERGLSGKKALPQDAGMLFVFTEPGFYGFWMRGMLISIDIIWLDKNFTVVDVAENITPDTFPRSFTPRVPAQYALEINAGDVERLNISLGKKIEIEPF